MSIKDKYQVKPIDSFLCRDWCLNKHYARRLPSISFSFGLFMRDRMVGILTIGKPASPYLCKGICGIENFDLVYELNRLCIDEDVDKNAKSFFVSRSIALIRQKMIIVSYADTQYGHHGYVYQASNWIYTGKTKERTDIDSGDSKHSRHYKKEDMKNRKHRSSKHRYVYFVGSKSQKKHLMKQLRYNILPYPKGDNKRYDASYTPNTQTQLF